MTEYSELKIRIERGDGDLFRVFASGPSGEASGEFVLPVEPLELENFILRVSRTRRGIRRVESPETQMATAFGGKLFDALFQARIRDLYRDSVSVARGEGKGLRVTLALTGVPELMHLPWEFLYDQPAFLSISAWTPVVRYLELPRGRRPLKVTLPLRILAMVSSPTDVPALDVGLERQNLEQALWTLIDNGSVEIEWLEDASLRALQHKLRQRTFHIFHYVGHGVYDHQLEDGVLLLEDEAEHARRVTGAELGTMLADHTSLRLAVLNACEGARASTDDPFAGVATSLVQREIPAVIAMQFEITDRAAIIFAGEFYAALADGWPVDAALAEARKAIYADHNDIEWGTPVLFMRVPDGRIFDLPAATTRPTTTTAVKDEPPSTPPPVPPPIEPPIQPPPLSERPPHPEPPPEPARAREDQPDRERTSTPAATPVAEQSRPTRGSRFRRRIIVASVSGFAVIAGIVLSIVLTSGGGGGGGGGGQGGKPIERLRAVIPDAVLANRQCKTTDLKTDLKPPPTMPTDAFSASIECLVDGGKFLVQYGLVRSNDAIDPFVKDFLDNRIRVNAKLKSSHVDLKGGVHPNADIRWCGAQGAQNRRSAIHTWLRLGKAGHYSTHGDSNLVLCYYVRDGAIWRIEWFDNESDVYAFAESTDRQALFDWWKSDAGPKHVYKQGG